MRYFFAILSLAVAAVLLVLGIGQRTFLAPPTSVSHAVDTSEGSEYAVIPSEVFELENGNPSVVVAGENVFVALAERRDIDGWLVPNTYDVSSANVENRQLETTRVTPEADAGEEEASEAPETDAEELSAADPRGSDLWLSEYEGETSVKVAVSPAVTQAVLVTSGDTPSAPEEVYVIWAQERSTPLAGPLLVTGGLFAALGIILYLFAIDHDRRGLGPRRGRRGPFLGLRNKRLKRRKESQVGASSQSRRGSRLGYSAAALLAVGVAVTGCSPSYWPQPAPEVAPLEQPENEEQLAVVPVTDQQIDTILTRVVEVSNEADRSLDASLLESRFAGAALTERSVNYTLQSEADDTAALPHLTTERLRYDLVQSTEKWPRTLFITVKSSTETFDPEAETNDEPEAEPETDSEAPAVEEEQSPTMVLLLRQEDAHSNYRVINTVALKGGIEMPAAAPLDEGTAVLSNDIKTLLLGPKASAASFAEILQKGSDSVEASQFFNLADEPLLQKFGAVWPAENCIEGLKCSQTVTASDEPVTTLSTGQGGALVIANLREDHIMEAESERDQVKLSSVETALGLEGSYSQVVRQWQHTILLFVPTADSTDKIQVLGSSTQVIGATGTTKE